MRENDGPSGKETRWYTLAWDFAARTAAGSPVLVHTVLWSSTPDEVVDGHRVTGDGRVVAAYNKSVRIYPSATDFSTETVIPVGLDDSDITDCDEWTATSLLCTDAGGNYEIISTDY